MIAAGVVLKAAVAQRWPAVDATMLLVLEKGGSRGLVSAVKLWVDAYFAHGSGDPNRLKCEKDIPCPDRAGWMNDQQWWAARFIRAQLIDDRQELVRLWREPGGTGYGDCVFALLSLIAEVLRTLEPGYARNEVTQTWRFTLLNPDRREAMAHLN